MSKGNPLVALRLPPELLHEVQRRARLDSLSVPALIRRELVRAFTGTPAKASGSLQEPASPRAEPATPPAPPRPSAKRLCANCQRKGDGVHPLPGCPVCAPSAPTKPARKPPQPLQAETSPLQESSDSPEQDEPTQEDLEDVSEEDLSEMLQHLREWRQQHFPSAQDL